MSVDTECLLARSPQGLEPAVRIVLATISRPNLVEHWPLVSPYAGDSLIDAAVLAANYRWGAPIGCQQTKASRFQREFIHALLLLPGLRETWCWTLPLLAHEQLSWEQGRDLTDQLVQLRRQQPVITPSNLQLSCLVTQH